MFLKNIRKLEKIMRDLVKKIKLFLTILVLLFSLLLNFYYFFAVKEKERQIKEKDKQVLYLQSNLRQRELDLRKIIEKIDKDNHSLIKRCGKIPKDVTVDKDNHFQIISGPIWSPDCRHIAFGKFQSGTSWLGENYPRESVFLNKRMDENDGIYLYDDRTGKTIKIYSPEQPADSLTFLYWFNSKKIVFLIGNKKKIIDVESFRVDDFKD